MQGLFFCLHKYFLKLILFMQRKKIKKHQKTSDVLMNQRNRLERFRWFRII